jgi:hypothetical protein
VGVDISQEEYENLVNAITDEKKSFFNKYLNVYPDNQLMIKGLRRFPVEGVMIYKLRVPLGKSFVIQRDSVYGEYPVIIDE